MGPKTFPGPFEKQALGKAFKLAKFNPRSHRQALQVIFVLQLLIVGN